MTDFTDKQPAALRFVQRNPAVSIEDKDTSEEERLWLRVRSAMRRAVRLRYASESAHASDFVYLQTAYARDPERYRKMHAEVKAEAMAEINPLARKTDE